MASGIRRVAWSVAARWERDDLLSVSGLAGAPDPAFARERLGPPRAETPHLTGGATRHPAAQRATPIGSLTFWSSLSALLAMLSAGAGDFELHPA